MNSNNRIQIFTELAEYGFTAGVTLKNSWGSFDDVYTYIRNELIHPDMTMIVPKQVHGVDIAVLDSANTRLLSDFDGVISKDDNLCLTVTTADCLPVLFVDPTSGLRAAVHVGWRCYVGGILENFFSVASNLGANLTTLKAIVGPAIDKCCFEVGSDVAILFDEQYIRRDSRACYVDLRGAVWNKIGALGVVKSNISGLSECTSCRIDKYYSYRRDKDSPIQMVTFVFRTKQ
jgi:polyphenol oxidase